MNFKIARKIVRHVVLIGLIFVTSLLVFFGGYDLGEKAGLTQGEKIGYDKGVQAMKNPKGNGYDFYVESQPALHSDASETLIYHSTTDCPEIEYGIKMNRYGYAYKRDNTEIYPYYFCSKCMNKYLIQECESRIIRAFNEQKNK